MTIFIFDLSYYLKVVFINMVTRCRAVRILGQTVIVAILGCLWMSVPPLCAGYQSRCVCVSCEDTKKPICGVVCVECVCSLLRFKSFRKHKQLNFIGVIVTFTVFWLASLCYPISCFDFNHFYFFLSLIFQIVYRLV